MKHRGPLLALLLVLAAFVGGLAVLFQLRLAQGDVFPPYSSLRADPLGTRALHDSLAQLPAMRVGRGFKPIEDLATAPARTIFMAGLRASRWSGVTREQFDSLDGAVRAGSRLVIGFRAEASQDVRERTAAKKEREERERKKQEEADGAGRESRRPKIIPADLARRWGARVKDRILMDRQEGATRAAEAPAAGLPEHVAWRSDLFFELENEAGWQVIYRRGGQPVLAERRLGRGSLVLAADSYFLSNEALQNDRAPALLAWIVGPHARVEFDEAHLGVQAQPGVAALARRYGLSGAFFTLLVLAALHVWREMALFVPPAENDSTELALAYSPAAGLEALLRRSVPPNELAAACAAEWKSTARESDCVRVEAALAAAPKNSSAAALYNAAARALKRTKDQGRGTKDQKSEAVLRTSPVRGP